MYVYVDQCYEYVCVVFRFRARVIVLVLKLQRTPFIIGARGGVAVKTLRYKPAGRGFDFRWCHLNFSVTESFWSHYGPGVDSASNGNEYQVYFLGEKAAGA